MGTKRSANARQVGGSHYKDKKGFPEHWDIVWHYDLDYFQGQITKYVMRWKKKGGLKDLEKAQHFLEKYIELVKKRKIPGRLLHRQRPLAPQPSRLVQK